LESPPYEAVTVWPDPTGAALEVHDVEPLVSVFEHMVVLPMLKVTVPVGGTLPAPGETVALYVTV
jgi:hypothetical protein